MSWADELEPAACCGSDAAFCGSDAAFPVRWRDGARTTRSPRGRLAPGRLHRRQVRPAALSRPSRRGRCRHPLQDDDVVLPPQSRLVTAGFFGRGLWGIGRRDV